MPGWLWVILLFAVLYGGSWLYQRWKENAKKKGGAEAKIAQVSETIGEGVERGFNELQWLIMKGAGVAAVLVAVLLLVYLFTGEFDFKALLGAVVIGGYGIYLLAPGDNKWFLFLW